LFSNNSSAFIGLPQNNEFHRGDMYEYTASSNTWRKITTFPSGNSLSTGSFTINNRMFVVGGWWSEYSKQVWEFKQD